MFVVPQPHVTRSILRAVGSVAVVIVGCFVVLSGFFWHYMNAWADHLSCPDIVLGQAGQVSPGGWTTAPSCNYPSGDWINPKVSEFSILRPTWSAVAFVVIVAACVIAVTFVLKALRRSGHSSGGAPIDSTGQLDKLSSSLSSDMPA